MKVFVSVFCPMHAKVIGILGTKHEIAQKDLYIYTICCFWKPKKKKEKGKEKTKINEREEDGKKESGDPPINLLWKSKSSTPLTLKAFIVNL